MSCIRSSFVHVTHSGLKAVKTSRNGSQQYTGIRTGPVSGNMEAIFTVRDQGEIVPSVTVRTIQDKGCHVLIVSDPSGNEIFRHETFLDKQPTDKQLARASKHITSGFDYRPNETTSEDKYSF